jgi:hypothetical protein
MIFRLLNLSVSSFSFAGPDWNAVGLNSLSISVKGVWSVFLCCESALSYRSKPAYID